MRRFLTFTAILFIAFYILNRVYPIPTASAEVTCDPSICPSDPDTRLPCLNEVTGKCEAQLQDVRKQEKTLKSQLALIDGQTKVTTLKIEETNLQIEKLQREISDLSTRIDRIGVTLDTLSEVLLRRIIQTYKYNETVSTFNLIFSSQNIADLLERLKYIQVAQAYDKQKLYELQATKLAYNDQKQDKQTRQQEAEKLNNDLEAYKAQLAQQKKAKDELLKITKNDEARYQSLIAQLKADTESIRRALGNIGVKIGSVKRGDVIAGVGNTGCSSGPHLHFEVMNNAKVENNAVVGKENKIDPKPLIDSGQMEKPLASYNGATCNEDSCPIGSISTSFGEWYDLGRHEGLDIVEYSRAPIRAAADGIAYAVSAPIGDWCPPKYRASPIGNGIIVDHQNGYVTLYWHIP